MSGQGLADQEISLGITVPMKALVGRGLRGVTPKTPGFDSGDIAIKVRIVIEIYHGQLRVHQGQAIGAGFCPSTNTGVGNDKGKVGDTQICADILDEVLHVLFVFSDRRAVDAIVPSLVPPESDQLVAAGGVVTGEVGCQVG
ncbi:MAG: hypothetical protein QNK86_03390 [Akkermansiaceae bacterium]